MALNKLQIRAKILPVLADLRADLRLSFDVFIEKTSDFHEIEDKRAIFDILCKEMSKDIDDKYTDILRAMTLEYIPREMFDEWSVEVLKSPNETDFLKYQIIQILKTIGSDIDYEEFFEYLEDAESIINYDTEKLLEHAVVNPETQIDFLDFLEALPKGDKTLLINSLADDYSGNNLANILSPVLYSDFDEEVLIKTIDILGETKSSIAVGSLEYLYDITKNDEIKILCKKSLNKLKLAGATKESADKFFKKIMSESVPYKCYTNVPDGHYNQGILFARQRKDDGSLMMFSLVISKIYGIVDCFGFFKLSVQEFEKIALRFSKDEIRFEVSPEYGKKLLDDAFNLTRLRKDNIKYEFICWAMLMCDIDPMMQTEEDYVKENVSEIQLNQKIVNLLFTTNYIDNWFFTIKDNEEFKALIDDFIQTDNLTFECVEDKIEKSFDLIWTEQTEKLLYKNIMTTSYLFAVTDFTDYAKILYSVLSRPDLKKKMQEDIIKKSVYEYFFYSKQEHKEFKFPTNIFRKKEQKNKEIDIKTIEKIIAEIEKKWVTQE